MTYKKTKIGLLMGFIAMVLAILASFVQISTIIFALLVVLLFVPPIVGMVIILGTGASAISKKMNPSRSDKETTGISN